MTKLADREAARAMYREGKTYNEIKAALQVSKSSVSLWCGDLAQIRLANHKKATVREKNRVRITREEKREKRARERVGQPALPPYDGYYFYDYVGEDGFHRKQLVNRQTGEHLMLSRARYNMSVALGRRLTKEERVHRNSSDPCDDRIENLRIVIKGTTPAKEVALKPCRTCGLDFRPSFTLRRYCSAACQNQKKVIKPIPSVENECVMCEKKFYGKVGTETCSKSCRATLIRALNHYRDK